MKKPKTIAKALSANAVQQNYIKKILKYHGNNTDDVYDNANFIAALTKVTRHLTKELTQWWDDNKLINDKPFYHYLEDAESDWQLRLVPASNGEEPILRTCKASIIIASHLSDVQEAALHPEDISDRLNFAKYLLFKFPNTEVDINAETEWEEFKKIKARTND